MAVGYDFRAMDIPLKMELEYRFRFHFDIESRRIEINNDILYDASVKSGHTVQVNFLVPWAISQISTFWPVAASESYGG